MASPEYSVTDFQASQQTLQELAVGKDAGVSSLGSTEGKCSVEEKRYFGAQHKHFVRFFTPPDSPSSRNCEILTVTYSGLLSN